MKNDGNDSTSGVITAAGYKLNKSAAGGDVTIDFQQDGTTTYTIGIDDSDSDIFKIHSHTSLEDNSDFKIDGSGNVTIGGDLTILGGNITNATTFFIVFCFGWNPKTTMTGDVASFPGYRIPYKTLSFFIRGHL